MDKDGNESVVTTTYKLIFIDSARFMATSLLNLVDNRDCSCFLEYESVKGNSIKHKCLPCNQNYSNKIDEELKKETLKHI